jgi:hypothetical protein
MNCVARATAMALSSTLGLDGKVLLLLVEKSPCPPPLAVAAQAKTMAANAVNGVAFMVFLPKK